MASDRSLFDRAMKRLAPKPDASFAPQPHELCDGLWLLERRLLHMGLALLPSQTTIVRLPDGALVVISPPACADAACLASIDSIGPVEYVVIPNSFHYVYASEFMRHYPEAALLSAPGMRQRVPELAIATELGAEPPQAWSGTLETVALGPVRGVAEVMFFHTWSATLIVTDLAFNMTRYPRAFDRMFWRLSGIPGSLGPGRTTRQLLLRDHAVASRALAKALEWPIERIVVAHGDVVDEGARGRFERAFSGYV